MVRLAFFMVRVSWIMVQHGAVRRYDTMYDTDRDSISITYGN